MNKTKYCIKCGAYLPLIYESKKPKGQCASCGPDITDRRDNIKNHSESEPSARGVV